MTSPAVYDLSVSTLMQPPGHAWRFPSSIQDVIEFALYFDGNKQPVIHDYPWSIPLIAIPLYWMMIYFGQKIMKNRQPFSLNVALQVWNLLLCVLSVGMFSGMFFPVLYFWKVNGFYELICMPNGELYYGFPFFCIWLFALSKYLELIDTLFIILRKRHLNFLHWYHHTTVLAYTWFSLVVMTPPGALFGVVNTFVHSIMYFYFYLTSIGKRPSWGRLVTLIQLTQMLVGITISSVWTYYFVTGTLCPMDHPYQYMIFTFLLYASYFALFLHFYLNRYSTAPTKRGDSQANTPTTPKKDTPQPPKKGTPTTKPKKE